MSTNYGGTLVGCHEHLDEFTMQVGKAMHEAGIDIKMQKVPEMNNQFSAATQPSSEVSVGVHATMHNAL